MKHLLTVQRADTGQYFIMDNTLTTKGNSIGQIGPYYKSMKYASIAMMRMSKEYTNIYDMSKKAYSELKSRRLA